MKDLSRRAVTIAIAASAIVGAGIAATTAKASTDYARSAGGLTVYLGVLPAEIVGGHPPAHPERRMHGGPPAGPHRYHLIASIFEMATGERISDAAVTGKVSGLGLSGPETTFEPMPLADTTTYGAFIYLPGADLYTILLSVRRPGATKPVLLEFKYDHRRE